MSTAAPPARQDPLTATPASEEEDDYAALVKPKGKKGKKRSTNRQQQEQADSTRQQHGGNRGGVVQTKLRLGNISKDDEDQPPESFLHNEVDVINNLAAKNGQGVIISKTKGKIKWSKGFPGPSSGAPHDRESQRQQRRRHPTAKAAQHERWICRTNQQQVRSEFKRLSSVQKAVVMASPNSHAASSAAAASRPAHTLRLLDGRQIALGRRLNGNATAIGRVYETELPPTGGARSSALKLFVLPSNHADKRERLIKDPEIGQVRRGLAPRRHIRAPLPYRPQQPRHARHRAPARPRGEEECLVIALQLLAGKEWQPVDDFLKEHSFSKLAQLKETRPRRTPRTWRVARGSLSTFYIFVDSLRKLQ
ncbi:unnamed protein product [Vitrella brassicaformis CCMP3155]|uniref:Uncharacterized protein n=1 Tax=Vitrella brassicaformis (strain CCMP3155) TaxID=1169540 RepID=A0A0G4F6J4_VITBC|nr:unnamed protein product [Vitrella brassicaformis CCMP3155]|eukprot:CEM08039.1 unnamed protein product [Vitrella brassicaformis CCMP3155]